MKWVRTTESLPEESTPRNINRVVVWHRGAFAVGWYIGGKSGREWRLEGSPSKWEDIDWWLDVENPPTEPSRKKEFQLTHRTGANRQNLIYTKTMTA